MRGKIFGWIVFCALAVFLAAGLLHKLVVKISFLCAFAGYVGYLISEKRKQPAFSRAKTGVNRAIFLFLAVALASVFLAYDFGHAESVFLERYLMYLLFFFLGVWGGSDDMRCRRLVYVFLAGVTIVSMDGVAFLMFKGHFERLFTTFSGVHLDGQGNYLLFGLILLIMLAFFHPRKDVRLLCAVCLLPVLTSVFLFFSRSIWIAFVAAFVIFTLFLRHVHKRFALLIVTVFISFIFLVPVLRERLLYNSRIFTLESLGDRPPQWKAALKIFRDHPLLGAGPGNYELLMYKVVPVSEYRDGKVHAHAHNMYLELLAETGIIGLFSFLLIFFSFFRFAVVRLRERFDPLNASFFLSICAALIADLAGSTILVGVFGASLFWILFGFACGRFQLLAGEKS